MTKVLITGVAGHLGSRLSDWILRNKEGVEIIGIDDLSWGYEENIPNDVVYLDYTLGKDGVLQDVPDVDYVFHFAAYAAEGRSPFIRHYNYTNNVLATAQVVNYCIERNVKRLVFTSSMAVYGRGTCPLREYYQRNPIDPYGVAKSACEQDIEIAGEQHGLDWCIIRPHNIIGPYQCIWQDYRNVFGIWIRQYLEGKPLRIYGDGKQKRAFSPINDCLPCLWRAATEEKAGKNIINLGGSSPVTINRASSILLGKVIKDGDYPKEHVQPRHEVKDAWCTTDWSETFLGYKEETSLRRCLRDMWSWAQEAWVLYPERRDRKDSAEFEISKGVYNFWRDS